MAGIGHSYHLARQRRGPVHWLEYDPGIYSTREEVLALAKVAAATGGGYASHIRSEDRDFWDTIDELIAIGRQHRMPVHVSHIKLGMHDLITSSAVSGGIALTGSTTWQEER